MLVPQILQMLLLPVGMRSGELFMILKGVTRTADTVRRQGRRAAKHITISKMWRTAKETKESYYNCIYHFSTSSVTFWVMTHPLRSTALVLLELFV